MFPCCTAVLGAQHDLRSFKGNFGLHLSPFGQSGFSIAQPHRSPVEAIGIDAISRTTELHHMLLLTRELFQLKFIQVDLQGGQSFF